VLRVAALAGAGLALRLVYVLLLSDDLRGEGDSRFYGEEANLLARGEGFADPLAPDEPTALHPPLLPLLLALPARLGANGYLTQRAFLALLGVATVIAVAFLARRLAGERAGLLAAALAAAYPVAIAADGALMPESLFGVLVVLALVAAYRCRDRATARRAALLGAIVGLATLTRGEGLLLVPLLALPLFVRERRLAQFAVACCACALVIAPWAVRNLVQFERPVLVSANDGTVLAGANCDEVYRGRDIGSWQIACVPPGDPEESVANAEYRERGLEYAGDNTGRLPAVAAARVARTFGLLQPIRQARAAEGRADWIEIAGAIAFYAIATLAAAGALLLRRRGAVLWIVLVPMALVLLVSVLGYGVPRFRHPADLALLALAAVALDSLLSARERQQ
jgi:4-amino-4-deoxy-L-arabinose transferase-like glycosyltransferase